jgi:hypothetical protein
VKGDPLDAAAVDRAMAHHDAVLSALGGRPWRSVPICSGAMRNITAAMAQHKVRRIVAISTFGAGQTRAHVGRIARHLLFGLVLRGEVADKEAMEKERQRPIWNGWSCDRAADRRPAASPMAEPPTTASIRGMAGCLVPTWQAFMLAQLHRGDWPRPPRLCSCTRSLFIATATFVTMTL